MLPKLWLCKQWAIRFLITENASVINFQGKQKSADFHDSELFQSSCMLQVLILTSPVAGAYMAFRVTQVSQGFSADTLWSWFTANNSWAHRPQNDGVFKFGSSSRDASRTATLEFHQAGWNLTIIKHCNGFLASWIITGNNDISIDISCTERCYWFLWMGQQTITNSV